MFSSFFWNEQKSFKLTPKISSMVKSAVHVCTHVQHIHQLKRSLKQIYQHLFDKSKVKKGEISDGVFSKKKE